MTVTKKLSISELAYISGVPESTVKHIFDGQTKNPGIVTIKKLCDGLDISVIDFFDSPLFKDLEQEIK